MNASKVMEHKISKRVYSLNMIRIPFTRWEEPGVPVLDEVSGCFVRPEDVCPVALGVFGQAGLMGGAAMQQVSCCFYTSDV